MLSICTTHVDNPEQAVRVSTMKRTHEIQQYILDSIPNHPKDIVAKTAASFNITRQAVNRHINNLIKNGLIHAEGNTKQRTYKLKVLNKVFFCVPLKNLEEDSLWRERIREYLTDLPENIFSIWHYGFTEMVNNAIDHSEGTNLTVVLEKTAATVHMLVIDDGVGIFKKIKEGIGLEDEKHAILELAKGKLTTDPQRHTGEGIFFSSRMFDHYIILSGEVYFSHSFDSDDDWIIESEVPKAGTVVSMMIKNNSKTTTKEIFDKFSSGGNTYGFNKTIVPIILAKQGPEQLISRSQAKRLLARFERFKVVILDFRGVDIIGPAFADEIFRVFAKSHPEVSLVPVRANRNIKNIINKAKTEPRY